MGRQERLPAPSSSTSPFVPHRLSFRVSLRFCFSLFIRCSIENNLCIVKDGVLVLVEGLKVVFLTSYLVCSLYERLRSLRWEFPTKYTRLKRFLRLFWTLSKDPISLFCRWWNIVWTTKNTIIDPRRSTNREIVARI
jgi:hypothetical protein